MPYLPTTHQLLIHEEPENGVHPKAIEVVLESLQSITTGQVWISSHSPVVLAHSQPKDILCLSLDEQGAAVAIQGDQHPALADWRSGLDLGTLFAAGVLG